MAVNSVLPPFPNFRDLSGAPLENGFIYIGQPEFEARSNPKASFFDVDLTIPTGTASGAAIRTKGGFPVRNGAPATIYVDGEFSVTVTDRNGVLIYSSKNSLLVVNPPAAGLIVANNGTVAAPGIAFQGSPGTGFYYRFSFSLGDLLSVSVNGAQIAEFGGLQSTFFGTCDFNGTIQADGGIQANGPVTGDGFISAARALSPDRNRIINGQGRINQRAYVSGTATIAANTYTLDRWRVVVAGQSLTFTGGDPRRTMTAPAGGCEQVIEGANIEGGTYVINWTGTANCRVDGVTRAKGETFTLAYGSDTTVRFLNGTFTDVQLELGTFPSEFERLPISDELARCQRYYFADTVDSANARLEASAGTLRFQRRMTFPVTMRVAPTTSFTTPTYTNCSDLSVFATATSWTERVTVTATGIYSATTYVAAFNAEL